MDTPQPVPSKIEKGWRLCKFCLIVRTAAHLSIKFKLKNVNLMQELQEKAGLLEALWIRAAAKS